MFTDSKENVACWLIFLGLLLPVAHRVSLILMLNPVGELLTLHSLRYYGKRIVPVVVFMLYLVFKDRESKTLNAFADIWVYTIAFLSSLICLGYFQGVRLPDLVGFQWQYIALAEWTLAFMTMFLITRFKLGSFEAFNYSVQSVSAAGWIHEIKSWNPLKAFVHYSHPLYIHTQLASCFFLIALTNSYRQGGDKIRMEVLSVSTAYILYYFALDPLIRLTTYEGNQALKALVQGWIRIPTMLLFIYYAWRIRK